jgi:hypothetical protein
MGKRACLLDFDDKKVTVQSFGNSEPQQKFVSVLQASTEQLRTRIIAIETFFHRPDSPADILMVPAIINALGSTYIVEPAFFEGMMGRLLVFHSATNRHMIGQHLGVPEDPMIEANQRTESLVLGFQYGESLQRTSTRLCITIKSDLERFN